MLTTLRMGTADPLADPSGLVAWLKSKADNENVGCKGECALSHYLLNATGRRCCVNRAEWWFRDDDDDSTPLSLWAGAMTRAYDAFLRQRGGFSIPAYVARPLLLRVLTDNGIPVDDDR